MLSPSPGPKYPCRETAPPQAGFTAGLGNDVRFDFATAVILPDGRVATSFQDRRHGDPKLAIELSGIVAEEAEPA